MEDTLSTPDASVRRHIRKLTLARVDAIRLALSQSMARREDLAPQIVELNTGLIYLGYPRGRLAIFTEHTGAIARDLENDSLWNEDGTWKGAAS